MTIRTCAKLLKSARILWPGLWVPTNVLFSFNVLQYSAVVTATKNPTALIRSIKFFSRDVALCFYFKSTIRSRFEYCFYAWPIAPSCYLGTIDKLQKWVCRTIGPSLATLLEHLPSLSLFYRHYFGRCLSELAELVLLHHSHGRSICCSYRLHDFSFTTPRCY